MTACIWDLVPAVIFDIVQTASFLMLSLLCCKSTGKYVRHPQSKAACVWFSDQLPIKSQIKRGQCAQ